MNLKLKSKDHNIIIIVFINYEIKNILYLCLHYIHYIILHYIYNFKVILIFYIKKHFF